jgi:formamidopyrimidine-DNA glycosylase
MSWKHPNSQMCEFLDNLLSIPKVMSLDNSGIKTFGETLIFELRLSEKTLMWVTERLHQKRAGAATMVLERLQSKTFKSKGFPNLLLNQHFLGGLGNYLRSEILFVAGIHPSLRPVDCSIEQLQKLAVALLEIPRQSYATKGITNSLSIVERLKKLGQTRRQYRHWVFGRQDCLCYLCSSEILKDTLGGRRVYFCPSCQAKHH